MVNFAKYDNMVIYEVFSNEKIFSIYNCIESFCIFIFIFLFLAFTAKIWYFIYLKRFLIDSSSSSKLFSNVFRKSIDNLSLQSFLVKVSFFGTMLFDTISFLSQISNKIAIFVIHLIYCLKLNDPSQHGCQNVSL